MKHFYSLTVFCIFFTISGVSQTETYFTSGGEMIFSFANIDDNGSSESSIMRWAPCFNVQSMVNADLNKHFGLFSGLAVRNVGYIYGKYKVYNFDRSMQADGNYTTYKKKFRSYNLAIPLGIKFGNLEKMFFYAGYEVELPFLYKEKTFENGDKINKITGWFSNRMNMFQHGFLVGIQFPYGMNLKFKYYLSNFHNQDYTDNNGFKPYENLTANIFYFSLSSYLFKNLDYSPGKPQDKKL